MRPQKVPRKVAEYKGYRAIAHKEGLTFLQAGGKKMTCTCCTDYTPHHRKSGKSQRRFKGHLQGGVDHDASCASVIGRDDITPEKEEPTIRRASIVTIAIQDIARAARPVKAKGVAKEFVILSPPSRVIVLEDDGIGPGLSTYEDDWEKI
ncbi:hypothetical protein BDQ17DRAFT_1344730 [Cyathus striatus]|nr:hypothetical protein BDQ17DRAFT_1344730 [Cyathus striatus]